MANTLILPPDRYRDAQEDEPALIIAAQSDATAFGMLHQRYEHRIYRYLLIRTGSVEDAADLTQQVFLQVLTALPQYQPRGIPFAAWLLRIAHNVEIDTQRRTRPTVSWNTLPENIYVSTTDEVENIVIQHDAINRLRLLLSSLDAEQKELISLRFVARLSVQEIACVLNKGESTIYRHLAKIMHTLKEQYHEEL